MDKQPNTSLSQFKKLTTRLADARSFSSGMPSDSDEFIESYRDAVEEDRLNRNDQLSDNDSVESEAPGTHNSLPLPRSLKIREDLCDQCLQPLPDCECPMQDLLESGMESRRASPPSPPRKHRPGKSKLVRKLEDEYAFLWYYDTRFKWRPKWANDYLRLPPLS